MKRVLLVLVALLVPAMLAAQPTMGIYFDMVPGLMAEFPQKFVPFAMYIYLHNAGVYVTAVEYQLQTPSDPTHADFQITGEIRYPEQYSVSLGGPFDGHSITYWPPLDGNSPGYNMICWFECLTTKPCWNEAGEGEPYLFEYPLVIGPHPDTGECKGTYYPENLPFPIIGLTSIVCPEIPVGVQDESWGAIKAMYDE